MQRRDVLKQLSAVVALAGTGLPVFAQGAGKGFPGLGLVVQASTFAGQQLRHGRGLLVQVPVRAGPRRRRAGGPAGLQAPLDLEQVLQVRVHARPIRRAQAALQVPA